MKFSRLVKGQVRAETANGTEHVPDEGWDDLVSTGPDRLQPTGPADGGLGGHGSRIRMARRRPY